METISVDKIMTKPPVSCNPDTPLNKVVEMLSWGEINAISVVEHKSGKTVGIISLFDVIQHADKSPKELGKIKAKSIMTPKSRLVTIPGTATIKEAADLMLEYKVHRIIVPDPKLPGKAMGVVSASDIIRAMIESKF